MYVNGLLTPDIYLERGVRHTLLVETGAGDLGNYQDFHPIYITSDSSGGHQLKPDLEAKVSFGGQTADELNQFRIQKNSSASKTSTSNVTNLLQIEEIYAGVERDREGIPVPSAFGRLCRWWGTRPAATYASYADFQKGLNLDCQDFENEGNEEKSAFTPKSMMSEHHVNKKDNRKRRPPGILQFTPTKDMPDTLYYQVSWKCSFFIKAFIEHE